jgi:hypothetical protein
VALAFLKTAVAQPGTSVLVGEVKGEVVEVPFSR